MFNFYLFIYFFILFYLDHKVDNVTPSPSHVPISSVSGQKALSNNHTTAAEPSSPPVEHDSLASAINNGQLNSNDRIDPSTYASLIAKQRPGNDSCEEANLSAGEHVSYCEETVASRPCTTDVEDDSSRGLKYIEVRPSDEDPYRGDAVLILASANNDSKNLSQVYDLQQGDYGSSILIKIHENNDGVISEKECEGCVLDNEMTPMATLETKRKSYGNEDQLLTSSFTSETPPSEPYATPLFSADLRREDLLQAGRAHRRCSSVGSKAMKRSSSVISDSGIESEPSSMACPEVRSRPPDFSSERDILQHLVRRHTVHRNSLEGFQTESNTSLPSGIQASLTSISSLPYEEEQDVELSKLTKSVSAPQISSPEDTEEGQELVNQDLDEESEGTGSYDREEPGIREDDKPIESPAGNRLFPESIDNILKNENTILNREPVTIQQENAPYMDSYDNSKDFDDSDKSGLKENHSDILGVESVLRGVPEVLLFQQFLQGHCTDDTAFTQIFGNSEDTQSNSMLKLEDPLRSAHGKFLLNDDQSFHQDQLNKTDKNEHSQLGDGLSQQPGDVAETPACPITSRASRMDSQTDGSQGKPSKLPTSSLAFVNKKVVEVVNMSVSCAPTCLPFSSVLRDSPSAVGLSNRQANSPITRQPLGSFGLIFSSTLCADVETNERMLK